LVRGLLFDLDGTLADTAPDLAGALAAVMTEEGRRSLPFEDVRPHVSFGAPRLVSIGFGEDIAESEFERLRSRLLEHYSAALCLETRLFDGMAEVLDRLASLDIPWGIVTNKPGWLTEPLIEAMNLPHPPRSVVSGDTLPRRKPHPDPLLLAASQIGVEARQCAYAGDARRDIEAGHAAGMFTVGVTWGYIPHDDEPADWGAHLLIHDPVDLIGVIAAAEEQS
jgi:2-phosphoglycolate phosphatase